VNERQQRDRTHLPLSVRMALRSCFWALVTCLSLATSSAFAQAPTLAIPDSPESPVAVRPLDFSPPSYFLLLREDTRQIVFSPLRWEERTWKKAGLGVGAVAILMLVDGRIKDVTRENASPETSRLSRAVQPFGSDYSWAVLGTFYGAGELMNNERASAVAKDGLTSSLIAAGLITPAIKAITGRSRPSQSEDENLFFIGGQSFPSGHTTQAFAVASVIAAHYDSAWVDAIAYGMAGLVGYARMEQDAHYASDVIAGAIIGIAVGRSVVRLNNERRGVRVQPTISSNGGAGLAVRLDLSTLRRRQVHEH